MLMKPHENYRKCTKMTIFPKNMTMNLHFDFFFTFSDTDKVFALADKYANTGFSVMSDYINEYSQNTLAMKLLADMDNMYEQYKDSF